jgi:hypothetical protein
MLLYLVETLNRLRTDEQTFFRMAHVWCFGTDPDVSNDVAQYKLHGIVPKYVQRYLTHVKEETS